jgi:Fe-Mn family superoxide dismutase
MQTFTEKKFIIGELKGISAKNIEEHLKLYSGYVKNTNMLLEKISELSKDEITNAYILGELQRRFSFEFCGMRNHEYYFSSLEGGPQTPEKESALSVSIAKNFESFGAWLLRFKSMAMTRGVGWAILYYDKKTDQLLNQWVDEHHLGQLASLSPILCLDMWEHAFVYDYPTSEKKKYVEAFFENLNWQIIEKNFTASIK